MALLCSTPLFQTLQELLFCLRVKAKDFPTAHGASMAWSLIMSLNSSPPSTLPVIQLQLPHWPPCSCSEHAGMLSGSIFAHTLPPTCDVFSRSRHVLPPHLLQSLICVTFSLRIFLANVTLKSLPRTLYLILLLYFFSLAPITHKLC